MKFLILLTKIKVFNTTYSLIKIYDNLKKSKSKKIFSKKF